MIAISFLEVAARAVLRSARQYRRIVSSVLYGIIVTGSLTLAYLVRFDFDSTEILSSRFGQAVILLILIRLGVNHLFRLTFSRWRFVGTSDMVRLLGAMTTGSVVFLGLIWGIGALHFVPPSVILLEWIFSAYATATYLDLVTLGEAQSNECLDSMPPMDTGQTDR